MRAIVCGFSGRLGSGKTSISKEIAGYFHWPRVSFGDYIRNVAQERGLDPSSRSVLQELGEMFINNDIEKFCKSVINQSAWRPGESLVIDGIRHLDILNKLKQIVGPSLFVLVYIDIDRSQRLERISRRDGLNKIEIDKLDIHSTEKEAGSILQELADIVIESDQPLDHVVFELVNYLKKRLTFG